MQRTRSIQAATAALFAALLLAGCGGSGGGDTGGGTSAATPDTGNSGTSSANNNFVAGIFLQSSGSGYVAFASSQNASSQFTGVASARLYTTSPTSTVFSTQTSKVIGQYNMTTSRQTIVTAQGDYSTLGLGNDIQVGQQNTSGFTYGLGGSPAILQATLTPTDVSGQAVSGIAGDATGGVAHTLATDTAPMPAGSVRYVTIVTATQPLLVVTSTATGLTLAQLQQQYGGATATLGDATYLTGMTGAPVSAYAQLNGAVYTASYVAAGQLAQLPLIAGTPYAYNQVAANFITQELQSHANSL